LRVAAIIRRRSAARGAAAARSALRGRVYSNGGTGGPVDTSAAYAGPVDTPYTTGTLTPGDWTFLVRVFDSGSGLEEGNLEATFRVLIAPDGSDATGVPRAPTGLSARPDAAGTLAVSWVYFLPYGSAGSASAAGRPAPTGFHVYAGTGPLSYATPALTAPYQGADSSSVKLTGLTPGVPVTVAVRAFNAAGEEVNAVTVTATPSGDAPGAPQPIGSSVVS
jgi:hypothetical protein